LSVNLLHEKRYSISVQTCLNCGGAWFESGELSKIDKIVEPTMLEIHHLPSEEEQLKALFCPSCENSPLMQKADHPRDEHVIIDYCPVCKGIWLDGGELEAIQQENFLKSIGRLFKGLIGI
jgi:Zn-finger nucleic acid-binding protein